MRTKSWSGIALASLTAFALAACAGQGSPQPGTTEGEKVPTSEAGESYTITIGHSQAATVPMNLGAERFKELVEDGSDGRIKVEVYPAEQLGSEPDMMDGLKIGNVSIAIIATAVLADTCPTLGAYALPYIISGETPTDQYQNLQTLTESEWNAGLISECAEDSGYRVVDNAWWYGNRELTTRDTPVNTPADMKGLIIRTPPADLHTMAISDFGAEVTPMPFSEVYTALDTGVIAGQENPISTIYQNTLYEVQDYLSLTSHMTQNQAVVMDDTFFSGLSKEDQELIVESIKAAGKYQSELQISVNEEQLELLKEEGMNVIEPDITALRAATVDSVTAHLDKLGLSLEEIMGLQK